MNKFTLPDEDVLAVGRVVVNFQQLESKIACLIWRIDSSDDELASQRKTAKKRFCDLCQELSLLFHARQIGPDFLAKFEGLMSRTSDINEARNRIVHSWWYADRSRLKFDRKNDAHLDSADIDCDKVALRIAELSDDFDQFVDELDKARIIRRDISALVNQEICDEAKIRVRKV